MPAADSDIRAECKRRFGRFEPGGGCVKIYAADTTTVIRTVECGGNWCPALRRVIEPTVGKPDDQVQDVGGQRMDAQKPPKRS